uniref:NADH-ubiquinone oxidoreductase chain 2 n=1 Tax=Aspidiphorus orbiculatus TaxID=577441 RepID=A0A0S2M6I7_9CUCU|nr:NADH deshydrogenase subunit 2 [Aspidiphorus orbiculatus]
MFINSLIIGTLISISSYSWFSMWMGLEINLLSIIPLMLDKKNKFPSESAMKYFTIQSLASMMMMLSMILMLTLHHLNFSNINNYLLNLALLMKAGAAPLHFWLPEIIEGLNWINCLLMLTWQKIAPMILLIMNFKMSLLLNLFIIASVTIGSTMGFNQISMRKIMTYSSINHLGWMLSSIMMNQSIWMIYFLIYSITLIPLIYSFHTLNIFLLSQFFLSIKSQNSKIFMFSSFMSLGGLPPFLGFFPKWVTINMLINNQFYTTALILILFTLITLFFYMRLIFSTFTMTMNETMLKFQFSKKKIFFMNWLNYLGLPVLTLIFNYF